MKERENATEPPLVALRYQTIDATERILLGRGIEGMWHRVQTPLFLCLCGGLVVLFLGLMLRIVLRT
jgi:hypothetical protein